MIWTLLLQLFLVLCPSYLYSLFMFSKYYKRHHTPNRYLIGSLCGIFGLLAMQNPALVILGHHWDLHWTLLILSFLLGGLTAGWVTTGIFVVYHLTTGWIMFPYDAVVYGLVLIPSVIIAERFYRKSLRNGIFLALLISVYTALTNLAIMLVYLAKQGNIGIVWNMPPDALHMMVYIAALSFIAMTAILCQSAYMLHYYHLQHEILRTEKLHLLSELAASVAHEVRNPLQVTRGFVQLSEQSGTGKQKEYLQMAIQELDRAEEIITEFLTFAKPQIDRMERLDICVLLSEVSQMMQSYSKLHGAKLICTVIPGLYIMGDPAKLKQVLVNVLKNAVESTEENGEIYMQALSDNGEVTIRISDNGVGMSQLELDQLGLPFYTTKQKGTGLGVMVTKRLIEAMKGKIRYESRPGSGTSVSITFQQLS